MLNPKEIREVGQEEKKREIEYRKKINKDYEAVFENRKIYFFDIEI